MRRQSLPQFHLLTRQEHIHKKVDLKTKNLLNNSKLNKSNSVTNYQNYCLNSKHLPNDKIPIKRSNIILHRFTKILSLFYINKNITITLSRDSALALYEALKLSLNK